MRDLALQASGALAIFVAIIHGAIAELRVFPKVRIELRRAWTLLRTVWQRRRTSIGSHWCFADRHVRARVRDRPPMDYSCGSCRIQLRRSRQCRGEPGGVILAGT